ncbi:MAG: DUF3800 domain-containing protein [Bacteroides sp.]|nr:DUF3800 domain-containing protein [Bacteroides sp.]
MAKYMSFIDECGNTGTDLLEMTQPLFILACVSVPETSADYLREQVTTTFNSLKEKEEKELKARRWLKSAPKREGMRRLLEKVRFHEGFITVVVVDKIWLLAALVVQNFLDPEFNPKANVYLGPTLFNPVYAREITAYFYSVIEKGDREIIAAAFRKSTLENIRRAFDYLVSITDNPEFKEIIEGCDINRLFDEELSCNAWEKAGVEYSPNLTAFADLGRRLAVSLEKRSSETDVVFDHCVEFDDPFSNLYEFCGGFKYVEEKDRVLGMNTWKGFINRFDVANSKSEPLLLLADIVATGFTKMTWKILKSEELDDFDHTLINLLKSSGLDKSINVLMAPTQGEDLLSRVSP